MVAGWLQRHQQQVITYLLEENRVLKARLGSRRLRLTDPERQRLAALAHPWGTSASRTWQPSPPLTRSCAGTSGSSRGSSMAVRNDGNLADRVSLRRSNSWSCAWPKRMPPEGIGGSRVRWRTWDTASMPSRCATSSVAITWNPLHNGGRRAWAGRSS